MKLGFPGEKTVYMPTFGDVYYAYPEPGLIVLVWVNLDSFVVGEQGFSIILTDYDDTLRDIQDKYLLNEVFNSLGRGSRRLDLRYVAEDELTVQLAIQHLVQCFKGGDTKHGQSLFKYEELT
jgi:hypothetical protein